MESLPDETIVKIFEILEENNRSFWSSESRNLSQTCVRFEDLYLNKLKRKLLLGKFLTMEHLLSVGRVVVTSICKTY
jgi:hypothetical protein